MSVRRCALLAALLAILAVGVRAAEPLSVAAASDLQAALPRVATLFEAQTGQKTRLTFGSSGNFFTQIQNGAPFDVFLSADIEYPQQLERAGLGEPGTLAEYARGHIVLWTRNDSGVDVRHGLSVLAAPAVRRIAIANPDHAPYGRAAVAALRHEGLYESVRRKFVLGENIAQTAQFAQSGNADVGIVGLSLALAPALTSAGKYFEIPETFYPAIAQAAIVVAGSKQKAAAKQFVQFLNSQAAAEVLQSAGFAVRRPVAR
jgi:molybdate transport system substrate-binding protein